MSEVRSINPALPARAEWQGRASFRDLGFRFADEPDALSSAGVVRIIDALDKRPTTTDRGTRSR